MDVRAVKVKKGRSITVKADTVIWLPPEYRSVTLLIASSEPVKHAEAPKQN